MKIKIVVILIALFLFFCIIELIRRRKLTFKYAFWWLVICIAGILLALYDCMLFRLAALIGFQLPSNFIFFLVSVFFILSSLLLTVYICQQNNRSETLAQKLAILELELQQLKEKK